MVAPSNTLSRAPTNQMQHIAAWVPGKIQSRGSGGPAKLRAEFSPVPHASQCQVLLLDNSF